MHLFDLLVLYLLAGAVCAAAVWRRHGTRPGRLASSLFALVLWPLWGPFALMDSHRAAATNTAQQPAAQPATPLALHLESQLNEAVAAADGTAFATMLGPAAARRMSSEVRRASARLAELDQLLQQPSFNRAAALERVDQLLQEAAQEPAAKTQLRSARLHLDNVERLARLQLAQQRALSELEQAIAALHSQLVVARFAGSCEEGVSAIVNDLWSRVEGLGEVLDTQEVPQAESAGSHKPVAEVRQTALNP